VIAGVGLISGLIGYGSAVAAAASERRREVALRRTLGASKSDIILQFLTENAVLGVLGGALGGVLALAIGVAASRAWSWPISFEPSVFGASALIGLVCGLVFGALPARRAASAPPAGAVRT
jgi:ABC-type antimicrobial peptide transport system permease subunit